MEQQENRKKRAGLLGAEVDALDGMVQLAEQMLEVDMLNKRKSETTALTDEEMLFFNTAFSEPGASQEGASLEPPSPKMRKTYLIPTDLVARFEKFCVEQNMKRTDAITIAMEEFLKKYNW